VDAGIESGCRKNGVDEGTWSGCSNNNCMQELKFQQKEKDAFKRRNLLALDLR
jgi:hypothetical protein